VAAKARLGMGCLVGTCLLRFVLYVYIYIYLFIYLNNICVYDSHGRGSSSQHLGIAALYRPTWSNVEGLYANDLRGLHPCQCPTWTWTTGPTWSQTLNPTWVDLRGQYGWTYVVMSAGGPTWSQPVYPTRVDLRGHFGRWTYVVATCTPRGLTYVVIYNPMRVDLRGRNVDARHIYIYVYI
jgi:hypothetical protein